MDEIIYDTSKPKTGRIVISDRSSAPEIGCVFTSLLERKCNKRDYVVRGFNNYTGYVKKGDYLSEEELVEGRYYRFIVVAVHSKDFHNYFHAVPFREVSNRESLSINVLPPESFVLLRDLAEKTLGIANERRRRNSRRAR